MKRVIVFILICVLSVLSTAAVQYWTATNLKATTSFYVGSKNVFSFLATLDTNNKTTTSHIGDSTITLPKLSATVINLIGAEGAVTNNPDDQTLETKGISIALKEGYGVAVDSAALKIWAKRDLTLGDMVYMAGLDQSLTPYNGGGFFVLGDSSDLAARLGSAAPDGGAIFDQTGTTDTVWYRARLDFEKRVFPQWYGTTEATSVSEAISFAEDINGILDLNGFTRLNNAYYVESDVDVVNVADDAAKKIVHFDKIENLGYSGYGQMKSWANKSNTDTMFVGTDVGGAFRSTDGGSTWNAIGRGLDARYVVTMEIVSDTIWAFTWASVYKSGDWGETWAIDSAGIGTLNYTSGVQGQQQKMMWSDVHNSTTLITVNEVNNFFYYKTVGTHAEWQLGDTIGTASMVCNKLISDDTNVWGMVMDGSDFKVYKATSLGGAFTLVATHTGFNYSDAIVKTGKATFELAIQGVDTTVWSTGDFVTLTIDTAGLPTNITDGGNEYNSVNGFFYMGDSLFLYIPNRGFYVYRTDTWYFKRDQRYDYLSRNGDQWQGGFSVTGTNDAVYMTGNNVSYLYEYADHYHTLNYNPTKRHYPYFGHNSGLSIMSMFATLEAEGRVYPLLDDIPAQQGRVEYYDLNSRSWGTMERPTKYGNNVAIPECRAGTYAFGRVWILISNEQAAGQDSSAGGIFSFLPTGGEYTWRDVDSMTTLHNSYFWYDIKAYNSRLWLACDSSKLYMSYFDPSATVDSVGIAWDSVAHAVLTNDPNTRLMLHESNGHLFMNAYNTNSATYMIEVLTSDGFSPVFTEVVADAKVNNIRAFHMFRDGSVIFGTAAGVVGATDRSTFETRFSTATRGESIESFAVHPENEDIVFGAVKINNQRQSAPAGALCLSLDKGLTWRWVDEPYDAQRSFQDVNWINNNGKWSLIAASGGTAMWMFTLSGPED